MRTLARTEPLHKPILFTIAVDNYPACCVCSLLPDSVELTEVPNDEISPRQAVGACRRLGEQRGTGTFFLQGSRALRQAHFLGNTPSLLLPGWPVRLNWNSFDKDPNPLLIETGFSVSLKKDPTTSHACQKRPSFLKGGYSNQLWRIN